ncbi:type II toxin-antitoxin system VapC family toxin [Candidatus Leptofilum sp.]|uniref:type II toxin-antitoxin system VapC family toxin n=1 Tax=Candidatus Leptofilum sp. TaxID=3241576 RepID=UPI003B594C1C
MIQVAIDTSMLVGLLDAKDIWHVKALSLKNYLIKADTQIVIFDCVIAEAVSVLARRFHEKRRDGEFSNLLTQIHESYPPSAISWIMRDLPQNYLAILELVRTSEGELNFNDALIALTCKAHNIQFVASFDRDFDKVEWLKRLASPKDLGQ